MKNRSKKINNNVDTNINYVLFHMSINHELSYNRYEHKKWLDAKKKANRKEEFQKKIKEKYIEVMNSSDTEEKIIFFKEYYKQCSLKQRLRLNDLLKAKKNK